MLGNRGQKLLDKILIGRHADIPKNKCYIRLSEGPYFRRGKVVVGYHDYFNSPEHALVGMLLDAKERGG